MTNDKEEEQSPYFMVVKVKVNEDRNDEERYTTAAIALLTSVISCLKRIGFHSEEAVREAITFALHEVFEDAPELPDEGNPQKQGETP